MQVAARRSGSDREWMGLAEACGTLGVSASTLRRWGDSGAVRTFVTPGGHRRFSRAGIEALLPQQPGARPTLTALGETPGRITRLYRREASAAASMPWIPELDEARRARFRGYGRTVVSSLLAALDEPDPARRAALLRTAGDACTEYGRVAGREGVSAAVATQIFVRFRRPFVSELAALARRRELDVTATTGLIADATDAIDDLMLEMLRGWEAATHRGRPAAR